MDVVVCLMILVALYVLISQILGFVALFKLRSLRKQKKQGKKMYPVLKEEYLKHEMFMFFTCTWVFGLAYNN